MKFFCFNVLFITFCLVCDVISDYSDLMLPSKDLRTMRLNMRVGKRFADSVYDEDEASKKYLRLLPRTGKRFLIPDQNTLSQFPHDTDHTDSHNEDTVVEVPLQEINKRELPNPKRRLRLVFRPGKRNYGNPEQTRFYTSPHQDETLEESSIKDLGAGAYSVHSNIPSCSKADTNYYEIRVYVADAKRSHFLMNPRVGKNDKHWKLRPLISLQKRSDPKATDLWFGPRLGRSNDEKFGPWNYMILNRNGVPKIPVYRNSLDDQPIEDSTN